MKAPELVMYACFGLIHLPHTKSMRSQTLCQLIQCGVRLHVNWVNAKRDSMSTDLMEKTPTFTKISLFSDDSVDVESDSVLIQLTWSLTWRWLSLRGMILPVKWVTVECSKIWKSWQIQEQNRTNSEALLYCLYVFDMCKKREQKSHASVL